jgi:RNA polymerase sigma-70 factor, ECF subfamily
MSTWLTRVLSGEPGFERELVDRYTHRLLAFAHQQLPARVRRRTDPEDVVQSVYRSFFRRLNEGRFSFTESQDVWRLLAAMTFHKTRNLVIFHQRGCRDVRREVPLDAGGDSSAAPVELPARPPRSEDVDTMFECLEQLLTGLSDSHREIVVRRLEGDSIEEIARRVKRTRQTVSRVLAHLQERAARQLESVP